MAALRRSLQRHRRIVAVLGRERLLQRCAPPHRRTRARMVGQTPVVRRPARDPACGDRGQPDCLRRPLRGTQRGGDISPRPSAAGHPRASRRSGCHGHAVSVLPSGGWARNGPDRESRVRHGCRGLRHTLARAARARRSEALPGTWCAHAGIDVQGRSVPGSAGARHSGCLGLPARPAVGPGRSRRRLCGRSCSNTHARAREDSVGSRQLATGALEFLVCPLRPGCWWQGLGTGHGRPPECY